MVLVVTVDTDWLVYPPPGRRLVRLNRPATLVVAMADTHLPGRRAFTVAVWLTVAVLAGIVGFTAVTGLANRMLQGWGAALFSAGMGHVGLARGAPGEGR